MTSSIYATGPAKQVFAVPSFTGPQISTLDNGTLVYLVPSSETETLRIEWVFEIGSAMAEKALQALACADLINKGTSKFSGFELNEQLDLTGSFFSAEAGRDYLTLRLFTLRRFLPDALPIVAQFMKEAVFPEHEFDVWLDGKKSAFEVSRKKTDYITSTRFPAFLFGEQSAYGKYTKPEHFEAIRVADAQTYHRNLLQTPFTVFVSGNMPTDGMTLLNRYFSDLTPTKKTDLGISYGTDYIAPSDKWYIPVEGAIQASLAVGKKMWLRDLDEYVPFMVMNTLFGGYFGSRLMSNLREKNGFTYGVSAGFSRMKHADVYKISTDVGAEVSEDALTEIFREVDVLQTDLAPEDELLRVKTYMAGAFIRSFDGPHAIMDRFKTLVLHKMPMNHFEEYARQVNDVTLEQVRSAAQAHLVDLLTVVSGNEK